MAQNALGRLRRQHFRDAILTAVLLAALVAAVVTQGWAWRAERMWYDLGLGLSAREAPSGIVIVAIDDQSLAEIGIWPWRRAVHATLLARLHAAQPRAIFLDLLLSEPDPDPRQDTLLAQAMRDAAPVLLPVAWYNPLGTTPRRIDPIPVLRSAAQLVQAEAQPDNDGIMRHVFLHAGMGQPDLPHAALGLLQAGGEKAPDDLPTTRSAPATRAPGTASTWVRDERMSIRFQGPAGTVMRVPYVDVLRGVVPAEVLRGKYVLVGMTAVGMGDTLATPMGGSSSEMPGVEVVAQVLESLRGNDVLRSPPQTAIAAVSSLSVLLMLAVFTRSSPRYAIGTALALVLVAAGGSLAMIGFGWWITPVGVIVGAALCYPLWSWRRLELNAAALDQELALLDADTLASTGSPRDAAPITGDRRWSAFNEAAERLRRARRFLAASLEGLPDAILLADSEGVVVLANRRAGLLFEVEDAAELVGLSLPRLLAEMGSTLAIDWSSQLEAVAQQRSALSVQVHMAGHGDFLLSVAPAPDADGPSLIVACADIGLITEAQRQREETLAFVTHDLRSPLASIALLADLHERGIQPLEPDAMMREVHHLATRALNLSEAFVRTAQAEHKPLELASSDLGSMVQDVLREIAPQALAQAITVSYVPLPARQTPCAFDRELMQRAVGNLVANAIKFSPRERGVTIAITSGQGGYLISVQDQGPGMNPQQLSSLFGAYARAGSDPAKSGVGLGLRFVQRVAERHGGWVRADSQPGKGARFDLFVPSR